MLKLSYNQKAWIKTAVICVVSYKATDVALKLATNHLVK